MYMFILSGDYLPSADKRLSKATVYPFGFFQFEMHGGIFQSDCSLAVTFLVGECITGAGGEGGARGIFVLSLKEVAHELGYNRESIQ